MNFFGYIQYYICRKQFLKYLWMRSLGLEMGVILHLILKFLRLEKFKFLVKRVEKLADIYGALLDELGIEILLNGKIIK